MQEGYHRCVSGSNHIVLNLIASANLSFTISLIYAQTAFAMLLG